MVEARRHRADQRAALSGEDSKLQAMRRILRIGMLAVVTRDDLRAV